MRPPLPLVLCLVLAGASMFLVLPAPSYDAWAWLLWGTEVLSGELSTSDGPAFKPLPVAASTLLAGLGAAGPWAWVFIARAAAAVGAWLAFRLARRLAGGSVIAGGLAAAGVLLCGGYLAYASEGVAEGMLLALALAAGEAWRAGRPRWALAAAVGCALLRVEIWPFLAVAAAVTWRRRPQDRWLLTTVALVVPAAWFVPELIGSGEILRSAGRARVPNPGQPALADVPVLASLRAGVALPLWPLWAGVGVLTWAAAVRREEAARAALVPAAVGVAWISLVAAMAQAGFSGEPRYALPGAALVASSGAVGLVVAGRRLPRWRGAALAAMSFFMVTAAVPRVASLADLRRAQAHQWALQADLARALDEAGGAAPVLGCGVAYVGPLRGPLAAYRLGVPKHVVEPDRLPRAPGVVLRSRLTPEDRPAPAVPAGFRQVAHAGAWQVFTSC
ncbi:MAG TPA: hypothetical protein VGR26_19345 [Acidimicrobiales bacterium]|nr:hypothetical protein [Acidimicrobiales bacterium]